VLAELAGQPMLSFMLERLAPLRVDALVVATTERTADDPIAELASAAGVAVARGPEADVLGRFGVAMDIAPSDFVVRLTADCPLADPSIVSAVIDHARSLAADYTSNTLQRTFPDGLDVEVLRSSALRAAITEAHDPAEREHVTPFLYRRPQRFVLAAHCSGRQLGRERWTVDTAEDLDWVRSVVERLPDWRTAGWQQIIDVAGFRAPPDDARPHLRPVCPGGRLTARSWEVVVDGHVENTARVDVDDGIGTLHYDGTLDLIEVETLVRRALEDDLQVVQLRSA
jgi:spore coat polysaccharide biosynthesis protein SpsF